MFKKMSRIRNDRVQEEMTFRSYGISNLRESAHSNCEKHIWGKNGGLIRFSSQNGPMQWRK